MRHTSITTTGCVALVCVALWCVMTLGADLALVAGVAKQIIARGYPAATGTLVKSEFKRDRSGEETGSVFEYTYSVNGASHAGTRFGYAAWSGGSSVAEEFARSHSPGDSVTVFYNPKRPRDAVLYTGLPPNTWIIAGILAPFNAVLVALGIALARKRAATENAASRPISQ